MRRSRTALIIGLSCAALAAIFFVASTAFVIRVASGLSRITIDQITIDPEAMQKAMRESVTATLNEGTPEQKLDMIRAVAVMGADAKELAPSLVIALGDDDPRVRVAASDALEMIGLAELDKKD